MMKMNKKVNEKTNFKTIKMAFVIIGLIFLSNPLVGLIDFLPNFIGYFLLILGLDGIKRLNGDIEYGVSKLKFLCVISLAFFVLMFFIFKMDSSWDLTLTFSYMALTLIIGLGACKNIFVGLDYLTDRHGSEGFPSVFEPLLMTRVYLLVKCVLVIIPKLYALIEVEAADNLAVDRDYSTILSTEKYAIAVCFVLSLMLAIAWLKYVLRYCAAIKKDEKLNGNLLNIYCSDYSQNGVPINFFNINFGSGLILISHICVYDFVLNTIHFLPEFISVLLSLIGIILIRKYISISEILKYSVFPFAFHVIIYFYRSKYIENVILETWDISVLHLVISSVLAIGFIVSTYMYFSKVHQVTSDAYERMFGKKLTEIYEWGDVFFFIALACGGANIICPVWRPYFVAVMIVSLFIAVFHFTKIYARR